MGKINKRAWDVTNIKNLTKSEAKEEISYLKKKGYDAKFKGGQIHLRPRKNIIL
jgi:hypothetical protein